MQVELKDAFEIGQRITIADAGESVTFMIRMLPASDCFQLYHELNGQREGMILWRIIEAHTVGWAGVRGPDGQPIPFSAESLCRLLGCRPHLGFALVNAILDRLKMLNRDGMGGDLQGG